MESILKRIVDQLKANKKAFDVCFGDDEALAPSLTRAERARLETIYAENIILLIDLDMLRSFLRGLK